MRFRPPRGRLRGARANPRLYLLDGLALDAIVAVIGVGLAVVTLRPAAIYFDQFGAIAPVGGDAVGRFGRRAGVALVQDDQVAAPEAARIEARDRVHRRRVHEPRHLAVERPGKSHRRLGAAAGADDIDLHAGIATLQI